MLLSHFLPGSFHEGGTYLHTPKAKSGEALAGPAWAMAQVIPARLGELASPFYRLGSRGLGGLGNCANYEATSWNIRARVPRPCPRCHVAGKCHSVLTLSRLQAETALALPFRHATQAERNLENTGPRPGGGPGCTGRWAGQPPAALPMGASWFPMAQHPAPGTQ